MWGPMYQFIKKHFFINDKFDRRYVLANQMALVFGLFAFPYFFICSYLNLPGQALVVILIDGILLSCIALNILCFKTISRYGIMLCVGIGCVFYASCFGEKAGIQYVLFSLSAAAFSLFNVEIERVKAGGAFLIPCSCFALLELSQYKLFTPTPLNGFYIILLKLTLITVTFLITGLSMLLFARAHEQGQQKIIKKNIELEIETRKAELHCREALKAKETVDHLIDVQKVSLESQKHLLTHLQESLTKLTQEKKEKEEALIREQEKLRTIQAQASKIEQDRISIIEKERQEKLLKQGAQVQQQILQPKLPESDYFKLFVSYRPSDYISGDYYRITLVVGDFLVALILDAAGHGAPAALMTGIIAKVLDDVFNHPDRYPLTDPAAMMGILNNLFFKEPRIQKMITGTYMVINLKTRQLMVSSAGGEAPLVYHMDDSTMVRVNNDGGPLGMYEDETYTATAFQLTERDILLGYTDGFFDHKLLDGSPLIPFDEVEGEDGSADYAYHYDHIEKWLKARPKSKKDIADYLAGKVIENCQTGKDDMTILSIFIV